VPLVAAMIVAGHPAGALAAPAQVEGKLEAANAPVGELDQTRTFGLPGGGAIYRFQQRVSGVRVLDGQATVADAPGTAPRLVTDATVADVGAPATPLLERAAAVAIASDSVEADRLRGPVSAELAIQPGDQDRLVWRVGIPAARPLGDFEVLVDAASGAVLESSDLLRDARTGRAKLFQPNPVVQYGGSRGLGGDHRDRNTRKLTALRRSASLREIDSGQSCLKGKWVNAKVGRDGHSVCRRSLNWKRVKRASNSFEALMTYHQITRAQQYIQELGFSDSNRPRNGIDDRRQVAIADAFRADNSFYSPLTRRIKYGTGGVDDAEDADVIVHEYGHAMQDDQSRAFLRSLGAEVGALQEGSADYWAAAMSASSPGTANEDDVCIFDWDATSYGAHFRAVAPFDSGRFCGRRADDPRTLAEAKDPGEACHRDIHCVGQVWSSALWNLRLEIGGRAMDRIYLTSQFMYEAQEQFADAAQHLLEADAALNGGANEDEICSEMEGNRGLTVEDCGS
jgi:hypothetical protein